MNRSTIFAALLLLGATAACSDDDSTSVESQATTTDSQATSTDSSSPDTTAAPAADGVPFVDPAGLFSVTFPLEPTESPGTAPLATGGSVDFIAYVAGDASSAYIANCIDYEAQGQTDIEVDLEGARDGALANIGGTLLASTEIELQGRDGLEFTGSVDAGGQAGVVTGRLFGSGLVLCQVMAVGVIGEGDGDAVAFLDSFRFLETAP